eukprot:Blabericola_migrator_1__3618@NODE_207_length_11402_cov_480_440053_g178_i0_p1_GENE_NODE_207_length_11402_cov_480_440053_g178_i0NODE_207_length_11402_cov_480_440053_g178_i0_p1_ORF_typecomplete_len1895_score294_63Integrin_beta/PF00362_18/5_2e24Integrin_beta/PF00362_18/1_8e23Integrin_beta/PF00362_18/7_7e02Integrin_beta/PF00362_18/3_8e19Integrin_beta/PF00362_18/8_9e20Integrin_beta/PF00362_18/2_4e20BrnA_antitoxin/PF14384_6/7_3e02BrnA_antitoxin/PF14384_6/48BrnA_antitoxin/PF14384_6/1_6e02BrnA_antitoxin/
MKYLFSITLFFVNSLSIPRAQGAGILRGTNTAVTETITSITAITTASKCNQKVDFVFLQETTSSHASFLPVLASQATDVMTLITSRYSDCHFGVAEFRDKPFFPLGEENDFCYRLTDALTDNLEGVQAAYSGLTADGGADLPASQYQALINVLLDEAVGWRSDATKIVLVITDNPVHLPNDYLNYDPAVYPGFPSYLPPNSGTITDQSNLTLECVEQDYPGWEQTRDVVTNSGAHVFFLTSSSQSNVISAWRWVNDDMLAQPADYYQMWDTSPASVTEQVEAMVDAYEATCEVSTTENPTSAATTEPTTTEATTVTTEAVATTLITPAAATTPGLGVESTTTFTSNCNSQVDFMFLQDTTAMFYGTLPKIADQVDEVMTLISSKYSGARFGLAEFRDKPFYPLGAADDYCYKLTDATLTTTTSDVISAYSSLVGDGGADEPGAQYQALINVILDQAVGWREDAAKIVLLITDTVMHLPNDYLNYPPADYPEMPSYFPPNSGTITDQSDLTLECLEQDYPSWEQTQSVVADNGVIVFILTPSSPANVVNAWTWVNEDMFGQPAAFYQFYDTSTVDIVDQMVSLLDAYESSCETTTVFPSTQGATTTKASTTTEKVAAATTALETTLEAISTAGVTTTTDLSTTATTTAGTAPGEATTISTSIAETTISTTITQTTIIATTAGDETTTSATTPAEATTIALTIAGAITSVSTIAEAGTSVTTTVEAATSVAAEATPVITTPVKATTLSTIAGSTTITTAAIVEATTLVATTAEGSTAMITAVTPAQATTVNTVAATSTNSLSTNSLSTIMGAVTATNELAAATTSESVTLLNSASTVSKTCGAMLDFMFLQDTTTTFDEPLPLIASQIGDIMRVVLSRYNDTRFGVAEFRDKPFYPLGVEGDYCYKLPAGGLTSEKDSIITLYASLFGDGGADLPASQYQALINVVLDEAVGWRQGAAKAVLLITDAKMHLPNSYLNYPPSEYPDMPAYLPPNSGTITDQSNLDFECLKQDYPSWEQTRDVLSDNGVSLFVLTPSDDAEVISVWRWVNDEMLSQPEEYYRYYDPVSVTIVDQIEAIMDAYDPVCLTEKPETTPAAATTEVIIEPSVESSVILKTTASADVSTSHEGSTASAVCGTMLDFMFLQDTTTTFYASLSLIASQIEDVMNTFLDRHEDGRFGVAEFRDKPFYPLGVEGEYCYKLPAGGLTDEKNSIITLYASLSGDGGADLPASQYQALINVVLDEAVGWRQGAAKAVLLITDAKMHLPNSYLNYPPAEYPDMPAYLPPNSGTITNQSNLDFECLEQDYPSWEQTRDVLLNNGVSLFILTPSDDAEVISVWRWVNDEMLGQPAEYYQYYDPSTVTIVNQIEAIADAYEPVCQTEKPEVTPAAATTEAVSDLSAESSVFVETTASTDVSTVRDGSTASADCGTMLDFMFLQDTTTTFYESLPQIATQIEDVMSMTLDKHEDGRFGVAGFRDKPFYPLGVEGDYCYKLFAGGLTSEKDSIITLYANLAGDGGADLPASQYQALINVVLDEAVGWRQGAAKAVLLITDAKMHLPNSYLNYPPSEYPDMPAYLPPNSGTVTDQSNLELECLEQDYPSWEQTRDVLLDNSVSLFIMTPSDDAEVISVWRWVNDEMLGQPQDYYQYYDPSNVTIVDQVEAILDAYKPVCPTEKPETTLMVASSADATENPVATTMQTLSKAVVTTVDATDIEPAQPTTTLTSPETAAAATTAALSDTTVHQPDTSSIPSTLMGGDTDQATDTPSPAFTTPMLTATTYASSGFQTLSHADGSTQEISFDITQAHSSTDTQFAIVTDSTTPLISNQTTRPAAASTEMRTPEATAYSTTTCHATNTFPPSCGGACTCEDPCIMPCCSRCCPDVVLAFEEAPQRLVVDYIL